jgi:hypothetical protein
MIVLKLLALNDWYNVAECVEIAKGKNELPTNLKKGFKQIKRISKWQLKK